MKMDAVHDISKFMGRFSELVCPYCFNSLDGFYFRKEYDQEHYLSEEDFSVHEGIMKCCDKCGWWYTNSCRIDGSYASYGYSEQEFGILKEFDVTSKETPMTVIKSYLYNDKSGVYYLHPRKLEELIKDVLYTRLGCQLEITQESRDGGYDLIGFNAEGEKILVEVKRYKKDHKVDIGIVRKFVGALIAENVQTGVVITTSSYTGPAMKYSELLKARSNSFVKIDLKDIKFIYDWLHEVSRDISGIEKRTVGFNGYEIIRENYGNYLKTW